MAPFARTRERHIAEESLKQCGRKIKTLVTVPFVSHSHIHLGTQARHLRFIHEPRVVVLVPGKRQAKSLHRVAKKTDGAIVIDRFESFENARKIVAAEVSHKPGKLV